MIVGANSRTSARFNDKRFRGKLLKARHSVIGCGGLWRGAFSGAVGRHLNFGPISNRLGDPISFKHQNSGPVGQVQRLKIGSISANKIGLNQVNDVSIGEAFNQMIGSVEIHYVGKRFGHVVGRENIDRVSSDLIHPIRVIFGDEPIRLHLDLDCVGDPTFDPVCLNVAGTAAAGKNTQSACDQGCD